MTIKSRLAALTAAAATITALGAAALGGAAMSAGPVAFASARSAGHAGPTVPLLNREMAGAGLSRLTPDIMASAPNVSGYAVIADRGRHLRFVSADFTVPTLNCANSPLGSAGLADVEQSVGLDGIRDRTIEAIGVSSVCDTTGTASYTGFYDMAPRKPVAFSGISAGDSLEASVFFDGANYRLQLQDLTTGNTTTVFQWCPRHSKCLNTSAEVLTTGGGNGSNLANFGVLSYTGAKVTSLRGKHGTLAPLRRYWRSVKITMVDYGGHQLAVPSVLQGHGQAFTVTWMRPS
jgi:hypothetical protein